MARRRIGQEDLIARPEPRAASSLTELAALIDWAEIDRAAAAFELDRQQRQPAEGPRQQRANDHGHVKRQADAHADHGHGLGAVLFAGQVRQQCHDGGRNRPGAL